MARTGPDQKYSEDFVKAELAKEGWILTSKYINVSTKITIYNPSVMRGHLCGARFNTWLKGMRPNMKSLINSTEYVREIFAEEGWVLLSEHNNATSTLIVRNPDVLNNFECTTSWSMWIAGYRPTAMSLVDRREYVRQEIEKEGWILVGDYKTNNSYIELYNPDVLNGNLCKFRFSYWLQDKRPSFKNLVDPTTYVSEVLRNEGWELVGNYINSQKHIYIRNKEKFNGHLCKVLFSLWMRGFRPCIGSLVDPTLYVKEELQKEGWELCSEYITHTDYLLIRKPEFFKNSLVRFTWDAWCFGYRPAFQSLVDPEKALEESVDMNGWEFVRIEMNHRTPLLFLRNKNYFDNFLCKVLYCNWSKDSKFSIVNVVDKTSYIKNVINKAGFYINDNDWIYENKSKMFTIVNKEYDTSHKINWSKISRDELPYTPKFRIVNSIKSYFNRREVIKDFETMKVFPKSYWEELNNKFPFIPKGFHIDHIVCLSYWQNTWEQMKLANSIDNLRLLPAKENISRGNRLRASELDEYDLWDLYYQAENPMSYELIEDRYDLAS